MKSYIFMLAALCTIQLTGCAPRSAYIPVSQNLPQFDSSKKFQGDLYLSANHLEVQLAHNPIKHLATTVNLNFGSGIAVYDAALGWYGHSRDARWRYMALAGIGYCSNLYFREPNARNMFTRLKNGYEVISLYNRYYVQPSLGLEDDFGYYDIRYGLAFSCRLSYLYFQRFTYREIDGERTIDPEHPVYVVDRSYRKEGLWTFEPALTHTVQRGPFTALLQLQAISPYSKVVDVRDTKFSPGLLLSGGFRYSFAFKKK